MPNQWKEYVAAYKEHRRLTLITPGDTEDQIKILIVSSRGKSAVITAPASQRAEIVKEAIASSPIVADLVALGTGPTPGPGPGPGPVGDDTIVHATLQAQGALNVLAQLLGTRGVHRQ